MTAAMNGGPPRTASRVTVKFAGVSGGIAGNLIVSKSSSMVLSYELLGASCYEKQWGREGKEA